MSSVAVIIVNYNAADLAIEAVESVRTKAPGTAVHLVDNASPDGDAEELRKAHSARGWGDEVVLYLEKTNHGFGRGNNLVLKALSEQPGPPDYVFLLNPDAQLKNNAIAVLVEFLDKHPEAAVAGARIEKPGGVPVTAAFRFPSILGEFSAAISFGPVSRLFSRWQVPLPVDQLTSKVDWVSGAAFMMRFDIVNAMGGFDPEFFLYYEEVELMRRLKRAHHQVWYVAEAEVIHVEGASTEIKSGESTRKRKPSYWYHSWQYYFRKTHGRTYAVAAGAVWMFGAALNHIIARLRGKQPAAGLHLFRDFWAVAGRPLLGLKAQPCD